jgi:hypothetical protein
MKKTNENQQESSSVQEPEEIITSLLEKLPTTAKNLIEESQDLSNEKNRKFLENPDDPLEHEPNWHQWGIITHTKMFEQLYREEIPQCLDRLGIRDKVQEKMAEKIDGLTKDQLLAMAIPLHDLGKFTERKIERKERIFEDHEAASGRIIRSPKFSEMLKQEYNLTDAQVEYMARCAELHYTLGIVRDEALKSDMGYTLAFAQSEEFRELAKKIMEQNPDFQLEIGLLFLGDSLAKNDIRIEGDTDEQIESQDLAIKKLLEARGLNSKLIKSVKQLPINRAIAENYLKVWAGAH